MKRAVYLGTDPSSFNALPRTEWEIIHYPLIKIVPRSLEALHSYYSSWDHYTHLFFTSKNAVRIVCAHLAHLQLDLSQLCIAVGKVTAEALKRAGAKQILVAEQETQEGIIALLQTLCLRSAHLFVPQSARSRPLLVQYLDNCKIKTTHFTLYDVLLQAPHPMPQWDKVDKVIFTSPSTVEAFVTHFGAVLSLEQCLWIGPITQSAVTRCFKWIPDSEKLIHKKDLET